MAKYSLGNEDFTMELFQYHQAYVSTLKSGVFPPTVTDQSALLGIPDAALRIDNQINYENIPPCYNVTCAMHSYGVKDQDSPEMWKGIITYLKTDAMPDCCQDQTERKSFILKMKNFFLHDRDHLWKIESKGKVPQLVIIDVDCCSALIAEAHNDVGHRG